MTRLADRDEVRKYVDQVAQKRGWVVNADVDLVSPLLAGLASQAARLGKPYCPCRDADGGEADRDIICPCAYASADIEACGQCYCGLFLAPGKNPADVQSIPERRAPS